MTLQKLCFIVRQMSFRKFSAHFRESFRRKTFENLSNNLSIDVKSQSSEIKLYPPRQHKSTRLKDSHN